MAPISVIMDGKRGVNFIRLPLQKTGLIAMQVSVPVLEMMG
ncbi:MAG: hypothetical protein O3B82_00300 [Bacteroidetes bacterium]|nr:hypothetical protein [Bacteroidota bacterium]